MADSQSGIMSGRRALLTEREREIISGEAEDEISDEYRYQTISRIRARLNRLEADLEALEAHGDLGDELRDIVCKTPTESSDTPR
jgi:phage terminase Nu1 subunit (DNA packaging protein)